ncbi:hypothetical protein ACINK0_01460 [Deinococcus sp. VB343]|uniref:hypothetical protein n=1 Tax=Deinococcus sp. VB343 TaxID=3385567 RepID=UPI0039C9F4A6
MTLIVFVLVAAVVAGYYRSALTPFLLGLAALALLNLLGTVDHLLTEARGLPLGWVGGAAVLVVAWGLFCLSRGALFFVALLLALNVSGLAMAVQQSAWALTGLEKRPLAQRIFCPDRLTANLRLYEVADDSSGLKVLVKTGTSQLTGGAVMCSATSRYLPLAERFDRWDADRNNVRTYMTVGEYRAVLFVPSLRHSRLMFPVKIENGVMQLPVGHHARWGVTVRPLPY